MDIINKSKSSSFCCAGVNTGAKFPVLLPAGVP